MNSGLSKLLAVVAALAAGGILACGGSEEISIKVDSEHVCTEIAKVVCENVFNCCTGAQIEKQFGLTLTTDAEKCRKDVRLICERTNPELLASLAGGTVKVDGESATTCLESLMVTDSCFVLAADDPTAPECDDELYVGLQGIGKGCLYDIECQGTAWCGTDRKCKALPGEGQPCSGIAPQPCDDGLFCDQDNTCQPFKKGGEECDFVAQCGEKLYCDNDPIEGENICKTQKSVGAQCTGDVQCSSGSCIPGLCDDGQACFRDSDCDGKCESSDTPCNTDDDCPGVCKSDSLLPCQDDTDCFAANDSCIHPVCEAQCIGQPLCGEEFMLVDYCQLGLALPQVGP